MNYQTLGNQLTRLQEKSTIQFTEQIVIIEVGYYETRISKVKVLRKHIIDSWKIEIWAVDRIIKYVETGKPCHTANLEQGQVHRTQIEAYPEGAEDTIRAIRNDTILDNLSRLPELGHYDRKPIEWLIQTFAPPNFGT